MADAPALPATPLPPPNAGGITGDGNASVALLLNRLFKSPQTGLAVGVMVILGMLIVPLPTMLLDLALVISVSFSVMILMTVLFINKPLDFSSFPTVLLVATLLRLALNLSSTRLILAHGNEGPDAAGHVIEAFAGFVMSGNFVIGVIVFAILTIVNFVVITKGSGRVAEVSARFALDSMPGKQMAIDADLSSGLIDENAARARRKELEAEYSFHGAMDGAAKFVRGDAIAGLIITFINIVAGIIIGVAQKNMSFAQAADNYIRLTVGDGLVTQVPALIVSVGAGLLVVKATDSGTALPGAPQQSLFAQMGRYPYALFLTSGLMFVFAIMPGMPFVFFAAMSAASGYMGYSIFNKTERTAAADARTAAAGVLAAPVADEPISKSLSIDNIRLELGYGLLSLVQAEGSARLTDHVKALRKSMAAELGFVLPEVHIMDDLTLPPNTYRVRIKEIEAARGEARPSQLLVMDPRGQAITLPGEATVEPAFGLPATWVDTSYREEAMFKGYTVVDPITVVVTHLREAVKSHLPDLLSYTETQKLLDELGKNHQRLVADVIPARLSLSALQRVLQNLLEEEISIRDLPSILEGISDVAPQVNDLRVITEHVRSRLSRQISEAYSADSMLPVVSLSPEWEQLLAEALGEGSNFALAPTDMQRFVNAARQTFERIIKMGERPVLMTSPKVREWVSVMLKRVPGLPKIAVLSHNEINPRVRIRTLGQL